MSRIVGYSERTVREDLPPRDVWTHNPMHLIETPIDDRGLVDFGELISVIKGTVDPSYTWDSPFNDRHHLQWPRRFYSDDQSGTGPNPAEFRHLGIGVVRVPRYFHNWVHLITVPPPVPSKEVMQYRIDAQRVALNLFEQVREVNHEGRRKSLTGVALQAYLLDQLERRFDDFARQVDDAKRQPRDFHVIRYDDYPLEGPKDIVLIAHTLARDAIYRSAVKEIRKPLAA